MHTTVAHCRQIGYIYLTIDPLHPAQPRIACRKFY
jgi:hypothetical protein